MFQSVQLQAQSQYICPILFSNWCCVDVSVMSLAKAHGSKKEQNVTIPACFNRCGAAYCPHVTVFMSKYCSWILRQGELNKFELHKILPDCKWLHEWDGFAFNSIYIFCWLTLGCYYSSLISSRWQEHQIDTGELHNTSFSNFFSIFSNITWFSTHISKISVLSLYTKVLSYSFSAGVHRMKKGISS